MEDIEKFYGTARLHIMQKYFRPIFFFFALLLSGIIIFYQPYLKVKQQTIDAINAEQSVFAQQAALGIEEFFNYYGKTLDYLANLDIIINLDEDGIKLLEDFYRHNNRQVSAITRISATGKIIYTVPYNEKYIGFDLTSQPHNRKIIDSHKPVVSDVFTAVQGYQTVVYAMPIFKGQKYDGCLSLLIPFELLARHYLAGLKVGKDGYAWMISRNGIELFSPVGGRAGKSILETAKASPSMMAVARRMMAGGSGHTTYCYDRTADKATSSIRKQIVVYQPVYLPNNYWSIAVSVPEEQVLASINNFRIRWMLLFSVFAILLFLYGIKVFQAHAVIREAEKRHRTEAELARSQQFLLQLFRESPVPMVIFDLQGKVEIINQRCQKLLGYSLKDIPTVDQWLQQGYADPALSKQSRRDWQRICQQLENNEACNSYQQTAAVICKDGSQKDVEISLVKIDDRFVAAIHDKTMEKQLEIEKQSLNRQKIRSGKMEALGLLAGSVAHDLNNILSGIINIPEIIILTQPLNPELRRHLENIKLAGKRAAAVVADLLTMARGVADIKKTCDLNQIVTDQMAASEQQELEKREPEIVFEWIPAQSPLPICCSENQIRKAVMNLLFNAAEAVRPKGRVSVKTTPETLTKHCEGFEMIEAGKYAVITISDNGPGIAKENLEHIFEPFFSNKVMGHSGTGLGLTVVWNCIHDHNGFIDIKTDSTGTTFNLYLPLSHKSINKEKSVANLESLCGRQEMILVVDDDENQRQIAGQLLKHLNYQVFRCASGEEALSWLKNNQADLIMVDMIMEPGISGREFYEIMIEKWPAQKTLIVSGFAESQDVRIIQVAGAGPFLKKPYTIAELGNAIRKALAKEIITQK